MCSVAAAALASMRLLALFLSQEYTALIKYIQMGKENDTDWFQIESNKEGTVWTGKVWYIYEMKKYEVCTLYRQNYMPGDEEVDGSMVLLLELLWRPCGERRLECLLVDMLPSNTLPPFPARATLKRPLPLLTAPANTHTQFDLKFDIPVSYPSTPPELVSRLE
jgi:hypothetical protein